MKSQLREVTILINSEEGVESRQETLLGREYTVFPVVMLVEGVVQGANASQPEYVPASELAKNPVSWNGRPLVMNHPQVKGSYVSANSPEVLEDWAFGFIFNTMAEDGKLKSEAWVDNLRAAELGGDAERALERLNNNEVVETSTGLWADTTAKSGKFNGRDYKGVWSNIVPDHLAVLSEDLVGACSIADGCGVGRTNLAKANETARKTGQNSQIRFNSEGFRTISLSDCGCGCGGSGGCGDKELKAMNIEGILDSIKKLLTGETGHEHEHSHTQAAPEPTAEEVTAMDAEFAANFDLSGLSVNSLPSGMTIDNVRQLLARALKIHFGVDSYVYVYTATTDVVVYQRSHYYSYDNDNLYQMSYTIDADGDVTFTGEPESVVLLTRIVRKNDEVPSRVNSGTQEEVDAMAGEHTTAADPNTSGQPATTPAATPEVQAQAAPMTTEQFLAAAPKEIRESIQRTLAREASQKVELIGKIKAHAGNKFSDAQLEAFDVDMLEGIVALAGASGDQGTPDYSGRAAPGHQTTAPNVNAAQDEQPSILEAPKVFSGVVRSPTDARFGFDLDTQQPAGRA